MPSRIRERKLVQWTLAYAAGAWLVLQGLEVASGPFAWAERTLGPAIILAIMGLPAVVVLAWYHGEKGRQKVAVTELVLLTGIAIVTGYTMFSFGGLESSSGREELAPGAVALDSNRYAVFPFRIEPDVPPSLNADLLLHDALARWSGIELVDLFQVADAMATRPGKPAEPTAAARLRAMARELGAGLYIRGSLSRVGRATRVDAALYQTDTGVPLRTAATLIEEDGTAPEGAFAELATRLLFGEVAAVDSASQYDVATRSYPAREAFLQGMMALREWDLDQADSAFAIAHGHDPEYARSYLWRAQVQNWNGRDPAEILPLAERAMASQETLPRRELPLATGLVQLARGEYLAACATYRKLMSANPRDFAALYGLGECQRRDHVVVRDQNSTTGWRYRSSYHRALNAYEAAFRLLPSIHRGFGSRTFETVDEIFYVSSARLRRGRAEPPDTLHFAARPAWIGDSLAFVPHPVIGAGTASPVETSWTAVERQRTRYLEIAEGWAQAFPNSPQALEALALGQELLGDARALETLREARRNAEDLPDSLRIAASEIVVRIKFLDPARYDDAAALGDSVLTVAGRRDGYGTTGLKVIAGLLGRADLAADLARRGSRGLDWKVTIPASLMAWAEALVAYSAFGAPADSIRAYERRLDAAIRNRIPHEHQELARHILLDRAASLAYMTVPLDQMAALASTSPYPLLRAQAAAARGDSVAARAELMGIVSRRRHLRPAELSIDAVLPEAHLRIELADTAGAIALLDGSLESLRWLEPGSLEDVARAASLVRSMALRAEVASAMGDTTLAKRWGGAVAALWQSADPAVRPLVDRMRQIANQVLAAQPAR